MSSSKKITMRCSDGTIFEVEETVMAECNAIKHMIDDGCTDDEIPLPIVKSNIFALVVEFCKKHSEAKTEAELTVLKSWEDEFVKVDLSILLELILAANYLNIKALMDLTCQAAADTIQNYSVEKVRSIFNIENDFTQDEEAEIGKKNEWAFEGIDDN